MKTLLQHVTLAMAVRSLPILGLFVSNPNGTDLRLVGVYALAVIVVESIFFIKPGFDFVKVQKETASEVMDNFLKRSKKRLPEIDLGMSVLVQRRNWNFRKILVPQFECSMAGRPDSGLWFPIGNGFCGQVFRRRECKAFFADFSALDARTIRERFQWPSRFQERTEAIQAIAAVAIVKERKNMWGTPVAECVGVLAAYAYNKEAVEFLRSPNAIKALTKSGSLIRRFI